MRNYKGLLRFARNDREHSTSCDIVRQCQIVKKRGGKVREPFVKFVETEFILVSLRGTSVTKQS